MSLVGTTSGSILVSGATRTIAFGAVRCDPDTGLWGLVDDDLHDPGGVDKIETFTDCIRIWYVERGLPVGVALCNPDERYVLAGVAAGISGGVDYAEVWFTIEKGDPPYARMNPTAAAFRAAWTNIWFEAKVPA